MHFSLQQVCRVLEIQVKRQVKRRRQARLFAQRLFQLVVHQPRRLAAEAVVTTKRFNGKTRMPPPEYPAATYTTSISVRCAIRIITNLNRPSAWERNRSYYIYVRIQLSYHIFLTNALCTKKNVTIGCSRKPSRHVPSRPKRGADHLIPDRQVCSVS